MGSIRDGMIYCYYLVKPFIPRGVQITLRRAMANRKRQSCGDIWPINRQAAQKPEKWHGWPDGKDFALVMTHDVDTFKGHQKCEQLMRLEESLGTRSSFNFVAGDYDVSPRLRDNLTEHGFEVGVHGLFHSHELYKSREIFKQHALRINQYLREWKAVGFRSPCMYHNLEWIHDLDIEYDASTFDTDPFEPQPDGVGTIFPFAVSAPSGGKGYVELPYTLPQDFTLFILFREKDIGTWKKKLAWVAEKGGMVLLNTHPDYMNFGSGPCGREEYPSRYYAELLEHIGREYAGRYWAALPRQMAEFWVTGKSDNIPPRVDAIGAPLPPSQVFPGEKNLNHSGTPATLCSLIDPMSR